MNYKVLKEFEDESSGSNSNSDALLPLWPVPEPLKTGVETLPQMSLSELRELVPPVLANRIADISRQVNVPFEPAAAMVFSVCAGLLGNSVEVSPTSKSNWTERPCSSWCALIADPGSKKSPLYKNGMSTVLEMEARALQQYSDALKLAAPKLKTLAARRKHLDKMLDVAVSGNDTAEIASLEMQFAALDSEEKAIAPKRQRYIVSDVTASKLISILAENERPIFFSRDDLDGTFQSCNQSGNETMRKLLLELHAGNGSHTQERVSSGGVHVDRPAITVSGTIQSEIAVQAASASQDGLIQRFGMAVFVGEITGDDQDVEPDTLANDDFRQFCQSISSINRSEPVNLKFSEDAQRLVVKDWLKKNRETVRDIDTRNRMKGHVSKYPTLFCGLAAIFAYASAYSTGQSISEVKTIELKDAARAAEWIDSVFLLHARLLYERNEFYSAARKLSQRIKLGFIQDGMTVRSIRRAQWEGLHTSTLIAGALEELEALGWLRIESVSKGTGRPSEIIRLNPLIQKEHA